MASGNAEVAAAEAKVEAAKQQVAAAKQEVAAAEAKVAAAKQEVEAAKLEYMAASDDVVKKMLLNSWAGAQKGLDGTEYGLKIARKGLDGAQGLLLRLQRATDAGTRATDCSVPVPRLGSHFSVLDVVFRVCFILHTAV